MSDEHDSNKYININERLRKLRYIMCFSFVSAVLLSQFVGDLIGTEVISIQGLKQKDNIEYIQIVDETTVFAKKTDGDSDGVSFYKAMIPNVEYFERHIDFDIPIYFSKGSNILSYIGYFVTLAIAGIIMYNMIKNMNGFKNMMSIEKEFDVKFTDIKFDDIIGQTNAKKLVAELVDILRNRDKYNNVGIKVPKGVLLHGPPGTGKTLIAKALAGECNLPFVSACGSDFNAMFVGVGSARIRNLYESASREAKLQGGCIIFIDEIDTIGQKRTFTHSYGSNSERENTLNQLLNEMDGFDSHTNVITLAATNRYDILDDALLRPGRFDRKISVNMPEMKDRVNLFQYYLKKMNISEETIENIADFSSKLTPGFSGADISNVVNEAGIIAVRNNSTEIRETDIKDAIDYVMMGSLKEDTLLDTEKDIVAYHEAGHAYLSYIFEEIENPIKVSIIPREKGMLGFSQSETSGEHLINKNKIKREINVLMGGRASEQIFCNDITSGASNDIEKATQLIKTYVNVFGFGKNKFINQVDNNVYKNDISNYIKDSADEEIVEILNWKYQETLNLIESNKDNISKIKECLLEKQTIFLDDIENVIDKTSVVIN